MSDSCGEPNQMKHRDSSWQKSPHELALLKNEALTGNKEAAWAVFLHYTLGLRKHAEAEQWLRLADKLGSPNAKKYLNEMKTAEPTQYAKYKKNGKLPKPGD
jgi:ADP-heptose:LPS heptosyltransferase